MCWIYLVPVMCESVLCSLHQELLVARNIHICWEYWEKNFSTNYLLKKCTYLSDICINNSSRINSVYYKYKLLWRKKALHMDSWSFEALASGWGPGWRSLSSAPAIQRMSGVCAGPRKNLPPFVWRTFPDFFRTRPAYLRT